MIAVSESCGNRIRRMSPARREVVELQKPNSSGAMQTSFRISYPSYLKGIPSLGGSTPGNPEGPQFMKRIGILFVALLLSGLTAVAQSSSSASSSTTGNDTNNDVTKQQ